MSNSWPHIAWKLLGYTPNKAQTEIIRAFIGDPEKGIDPIRFILICGGERAGKSFTSVAMAMLRMGPEYDEDGNPVPRRYWIVGPDYAQARAEFQYVFDALLKGELIESYSMPETKTQPWILKTNYGVTVETRTSSDISKLASFTIHGALMVEAAQQNYEVWLKLRGRVSQTRGWVILSGTLEKGLPWYGGMLRRWRGKNADGGKSFSLPSWSNLAVYPGGREDPEIKALEATFPHDLFMERFGAEAHTQHGLVIPEFNPAVHIRDLELARDENNKPLPVHLAVDPATHTYAVLFIQKIGPYAHVLDAVYEHNAVAQDVILRCKERPYWEYVDRRNGNAIDIAGTQRHANKSQVEIWNEEAGVSFASRFIPLNTTIQTVRFRLGNTNSLGEPLVYFNSTLPNPDPLPDGTAAAFLSEFDIWKWPDRAANQNVPKVPIDRANDGIKALGYWLVHTYGPIEMRKKKAITQALPQWGMR
jgi:hypothetical protein